MSADATENNEAGKRAGDGVARVHVLVCTERSGMLSLPMVSGDLEAGGSGICRPLKEEHSRQRHLGP